MPKHNALCPDIHRRGGFFQRRAAGKEQVYGGQDLVLGALGPNIFQTYSYQNKKCQQKQ